MSGRIVAELGRPETPGETADRKAASRAAHYRNQTTLNLVLALVASLAVVLVVVMVVVRPDASTPTKAVDYAAVAAKAGASATLATPELPTGWTANRAEWSADTQDGVPHWSIGFLTPKTQYIGLDQGVGGNASWVANLLESKLATGTETIGGVSWTVYDHRTAQDAGNLAYALTAELGGSEVVLAGTASSSEFRVLATAVGAQLGQGR